MQLKIVLRVKTFFKNLVLDIVDRLEAAVIM